MEFFPSNINCNKYCKHKNLIVLLDKFSFFAISFLETFDFKNIAVMANFYSGLHMLLQKLQIVRLFFTTALPENLATLFSIIA